MQDHDPDALETALRALRLEYLFEAPERIRELSASLGRLRAGDATALADLERYFHRLAGSGGSYGFPEITERGRAAELTVRALAAEARTLQRADFEVLESLVLRVAEVFQMAQRQLDAGGPPA